MLECVRADREDQPDRHNGQMEGQADSPDETNLASEESDPGTPPTERDAGEPPIFVGFGSMPAAGEIIRPLISAARAVQRRIIVARGWAELDLIDDAPDGIVVGEVSHEALFPRVAAVVHHGAAGTTAAAARAGTPQLITPIGGDQFYWARRVVDLGVGATTAHSTMTERSIAGAFQEVLDPALMARAHALASQVGRAGAEIAARQLEAEYHSAGN